MATNKKKTNIRFIIILTVLIVLGGGFGIMKYLHSQQHQETDDAQLESDITGVIPRVSGYIKDIRVKDNQYVHKGDTLIILDDHDYRVRLAEAEAGVQIAESNISLSEAGEATSQSNIPVSQAQEKTIGASIETAKINLWRANNDFERYANLYKDHSITKQQYEQALAAKQSAEAQLRAVQDQQAAAMHQTNVARTQTNASAQQIRVAQANYTKSKTAVDAAKLNLSYTIITAPVDGFVSRINLQTGQFVQPGQSLFNLVGQKIWIVANFKETQMDKIRPGQSVEISVDAYPSHKFDGKVTSFAPATGSKFALLPPDNASGNFVKVVQRIPVKIEFTDSKDEMLKLLRPGMNVIVDVDTK